jgi:hypothetical protein
MYNKRHIKSYSSNGTREKNERKKFCGTFDVWENVNFL